VGLFTAWQDPDTLPESSNIDESLTYVNADNDQ